MNENPSPPNTGLTVLVVDDEPGLADLYTRWLEERYTARATYSGEDALDQLDESVDVVLLDRRMPGMSGDEVLDEIRSRDLPCRVAMVTAVEPDFDVIEMGFDDYVTKPVSEEQLMDVVESLNSRRQYDARIQEWFSLEAKRGALETEKSDVELATHDEYTDLLERIVTLREELDERVQSFDDEDFRAAFLTLGEPDQTDPQPTEAQNNQQNHPAGNNPAKNRE